jgi:hypothetical protein
MKEKAATMNNYIRHFYFHLRDTGQPAIAALANARNLASKPERTDRCAFYPHQDMIVCITASNFHGYSLDNVAKIKQQYPDFNKLD